MLSKAGQFHIPATLPSFQHPKGTIKPIHERKAGNGKRSAMNGKTNEHS
jgi:hypothetical protein